MRIAENCRRFLRRKIRNRPPLHPHARVFLSVAILPLLLLSAASAAFAGSATWKLSPSSGVWNTATNWTPPTVPNGPNDVATFGLSNTTSIVNDAAGDIEVNSIVFNAGASAFTIGFADGSFVHSFTISGVGITNNSGITQNFVVLDGGDDATMTFKNSATAGDQTVFTVEDSLCHLEFQDTSTAGNATLIANSLGTILFTGDSIGDTTRIELFHGTLDVSAHNAPGVTVGSIGGNGLIHLGDNNLSVGSNKLSTIFSGVIDSAAGGSLTKVGIGALTLTNANSYSGGTTVSRGDLVVRNKTGSATGDGSVEVNAGRLSGTGIIAGPVTVGTGSGSGAFLSPGQQTKESNRTPRTLGTLTLMDTLTFNADAAYSFELSRDSATSDQVIASGVTISRAHFSAIDVSSGFLSSTELYDSVNGTWSATGSLAIARIYHTATLLLNGMVLVAGGLGATGFALDSAELYDPATGTWAATGSLTARFGHTATLLLDGKVLVAGGQGSNFIGLTSAELYDPVNGTWTATGSMASPRFNQTATLLADGRVLVAGGYNFSGALASAELYDPATGIWSTTGSLTQVRYFHTATLLPSGRVFVAGGRDNNYFQLASAELYNPVTGTWSPVRNLATARDSHTATLLSTGKVLVAGGFGGDASAELYDPATGTWSATGSLAEARAYHTATLLPNGQVLAAAGFSTANPYPPIANAELYVPATGTWTNTSSLADARGGHTATLLQSGNVVVVGGVGPETLPLGTVFTAINNTSATPITGTFINLPDGSILTLGPNNFEVSYSGGDGNDLTLTVVP